MVIHAAVKSVLDRHRRRCPKCHHHQQVAAQKTHATVKCEKCGAEIPPRKK